MENRFSEKREKRDRKKEKAINLHLSVINLKFNFMEKLSPHNLHTHFESVQAKSKF